MCGHLVKQVIIRSNLLNILRHLCFMSVLPDTNSKTVLILKKAGTKKTTD
jgi:hypothetical protein